MFEQKATKQTKKEVDKMKEMPHFFRFVLCCLGFLLSNLL